MLKRKLISSIRLNKVNSDFKSLIYVDMYDFMYSLV